MCDVTSDFSTLKIAFLRVSVYYIRPLVSHLDLESTEAPSDSSVHVRIAAFPFMFVVLHSRSRSYLLHSCSRFASMSSRTCVYVCTYKLLPFPRLLLTIIITSHSWKRVNTRLYILFSLLQFFLSNSSNNGTIPLLKRAGINSSTITVLESEVITSESIFFGLSNTHLEHILPKVKVGQHVLLTKIWNDHIQVHNLRIFGF